MDQPLAKFDPKPAEIPPCLLHLLEMRDVGKLGQILLDLEWTFEEELTKTIEVARTGSCKEKLQAMDRLRKLQTELLEENGMIVTHTQEITRDQDGLDRARLTSVRRLVQRQPISLATPAVVDLTPSEDSAKTNPAALPEQTLDRPPQLPQPGASPPVGPLPAQRETLPPDSGDG